MDERQETPQVVGLVVEVEPSGSVRGFVTAPTAEELKPTEREAFLLDTLWKWQETSAKSRIVLGQPLNP